MRKLYRVTINNHHICWAAAFGLGLFLGNNYSPFFNISTPMCLFLTGTALLCSFCGPAYIIFNKISGWEIPETRIFLLIVVIPFILMVFMGSIIPLSFEKDSYLLHMEIVSEL